MVDAANSFDALPDEVFELIFAAVADCKSLVRCMAVSKAFKEQSSRVSSLSITCPGQFSSYDQKLRGVYAMVKEFHSLEMLIVRVGQPKDEPPSWARCMRYAEIGASVEKFVFMAAKAGDFSEFDNALGGGREFSRGGGRDADAGEMVVVVNDSDSADRPPGPLDTARSESDNHGDASTSDQRSELEGRGETSQPLNLGLDLQQESNPGVFTLRATDEPEASTSTLLPVLRPARGGQGATSQDEVGLQNVGETGGLFESNDNLTTGILGPRPDFVNRRLLDRRRLLLEQGDVSQESQRLPDFNLRQVIAPSNDVLKRMVPVIVFAIVQGLDEFRDSVPEFIARFTELKRFLLVDMVESVTVHMREQQIQEIRMQRLREKEVERQGRGYEKEMAQTDLGSPVRFGGRRESENGERNSGGSRGKLDDWENKEEKSRRETDGSHFVGNPRAGTLERRDSRGKGLKGDLGQSSNSKGKGLKIEVDGRNREVASCWDETGKEKGKLVAEQDTLADAREGEKGEQFLSLKQEFNLWETPSLNVWEMGESTSKSPALGTVTGTASNQTSVTSFSNSLMQLNVLASSSIDSSQQEEASNPGALLNTGASLRIPNCKRCENLRAVGKEGPCWNCSTKIANGCGPERLENQDWGSSNTDRESYRWASDNPYLGATHNQRRGSGWYGRDRSDFSGGGQSSRRFSSFEKLVGIHSGEDGLAKQPILPAKETDPLLPAELAPSSSYVSLSKLSFAAKTPSESILSDDLKDSFNEGYYGFKESGGSGEEGLWEAGQSMFPSSSEETETHLQVDALGETIDVLRNPRELGRSRSFDSLESLKDKEEREEILTLERERLAAEKAKSEKRQQPPKRLESSTSVGKPTPAELEMGKKLKEKTKGDTSDGISAPRRSWKAAEDAREGKSELAGKYSFKRNMRSEAVKRREGDQVVRIGSLCNREEDRKSGVEASIDKREEIMAADTEKAEMYEVGGESHVDSAVEGQPSSNAKNVEVPETSGTGFLGEGGLRAASGLRLAGDDSSCSEPRLTEGVLKDWKGKQVLVEGEEASSLEDKSIPVSHVSNAGSWDAPAHEFTGSASLGGLELRPSAPSEGTGESSDSHEEGSERPGPGRGRERQRAREQGHFGWRRRDHSGEQLRSAGDMRTERERLAQNEAAQLGVPGLEERVAERETWRETWRERVGRRVREMRRETQGPSESEREREARRERLREGVRKRQRDIEREALFFDISFWRAEQIIARGYCLSDVSMCIATHAAKPLAPAELDILSGAALAGPLLTATVAYVNKQVGSHNL